jgi:hypothetical protein
VDVTAAGLIVGMLILVSLGALAVFSLALAQVFAGWGIFVFYTVPALAIVAWGWREFSPSTWRRASWPFVRGWYAVGRPGRRNRAGRLSDRRPLPPPSEEPHHSQAAGGIRRGGQATEPVVAFIQGAIAPWLVLMRAFLAAGRSPRGRRVVTVVSGVGAVGMFALVGRHFTSLGWPLDHADLGLVAIAGSLFLCSYAFKAFGWQRLFRAPERPRPLTLAAASGAASVTGAALPGRFDDVVRVAVVRRFTGPLPRVGTIVLTLFLLGLLDATALAPFAAAAAATTDATRWIQIVLAVVAAAGVLAAGLIAVLPRVATSRRLGHYRLGRWLSRHAPASTRDAWHSAILVTSSWFIRAVGLVALLAALGFARSFELAVVFLSAGAASAALPIGPAGAATQAGAGAAVFVASGIDTDKAIAFAIVAQSLSILAGATIVLFMALVRARQQLRKRRA